MESQKLFRKQAIEKIQSPDQLNDYIRVTTPSVWLILLSVLLLTAGILVWAVFGEIRVTTEEGTKTVAPITYVIR